jgi:hypothetical protein
MTNFALLLTGQQRTYERCFPSIWQHLLEPFAPDVYACLEGEQAEQVGALYQAAALHVVTPDESRAAVGNAEERYLNKSWESIVFDNVAIFYKNKVAWELLRATQKHYDVVFITRPDVLISSFAYDFTQPLDEATLYQPRVDAFGTTCDVNNLFYGGWGGQLLFTTEDVAEIHMTLYEHLDEVYASLGEWHFERLCRHWLMQQHITVKLFDIDFKLVRMNSLT